MHLGCSESDKSLHLFGCVFGIEIEVNAGRELHRRSHRVEGDVRTIAVSRRQQNEVVAVDLPGVVESVAPELSLPLEVVDPDDDGTNANRDATLPHRGAWIGTGARLGDGGSKIPQGWAVSCSPWTTIGPSR